MVNLFRTFLIESTFGQVLEDGIFIHKGTHPDVESYSAFWDNSKIQQTKLYEFMKEKKITDLYVCGLAYDVCVGKKKKKEVLFLSLFFFKYDFDFQILHEKERQPNTRSSMDSGPFW